jgi:integrase
MMRATTMARLVRTSNLREAPVTAVAVDEVYDGDGRLRQPADFDRDFSRAIAKMGRGLKPRTVATYRPYLGAYWQLCLVRGAQLEDAELFRGFVLAVARNANRKPSASTLQVVCSAVASLLKALSMRSPLHDPATRHWLAVEMATRARRKPKRSDAILTDQIDQAIASTAAMIAVGGALRMRGLRDRALILLGWTCALRRSELVAVHVSHIRRTRIKGWELIIPESKTGQGEDQLIPIIRATRPRYDAMAAVDAWTAAAGIRGDAPLFRRVRRDGSLGDEQLNPTAVRDILRAHGLGEGFSPHSLRSGFVTQARLNGAATHQIRVVTRHRSDLMVDIYTRQVDPDRQGPGSLA